MKKEIVENIKRCLLNRKEILFAYVLGTFLDSDDFNDIDVALFLDEKKMKTIDTIDYEINTSLLLENQIKPVKKIKRYVPVDVKIINCAPLSFKYSVSRGSLLFSKDEEAREEFLCRTWQEYFDFLPVANKYLKEVLNAEV